MNEGSSVWPVTVNDQRFVEKLQYYLQENETENG